MAQIDQTHKCHPEVDTTNDMSSFPVRWARADTFKVSSARKAKKVWYGVCGFSHRIFRVASMPLELIVISDIIIDHGRCEESKYCLARNCPLNRTTESTIKKMLHVRSRSLEAASMLTRDRQCGAFRDDPRASGLIMPK